MAFAICVYTGWYERFVQVKKYSTRKLEKTRIIHLIAHNITMFIKMKVFSSKYHVSTMYILSYFHHLISLPCYIFVITSFLVFVNFCRSIGRVVRTSWVDAFWSQLKTLRSSKWHTDSEFQTTFLFELPSNCLEWLSSRDWWTCLF